MTEHPAKAVRESADGAWRLVRPGEIGPVEGKHGNWVETDHPAVVACMGSVHACAEGGCQYRVLRAAVEKLMERVGATHLEKMSRVQIAGLLSDLLDSAPVPTPKD